MFLFSNFHVRRGPAQVLAAVLLDGGDEGQGEGPPAFQLQVPGKQTLEKPSSHTQTTDSCNREKMTPQEFVQNLPELNDGHNFPEKLLEVYLAIKTELIQWVQDKSA